MKFVKNAINLLKWPTHLLVVGAQLKITFQTLWQIKRSNKTENKEKGKQKEKQKSRNNFSTNDRGYAPFKFPFQAAISVWNTRNVGTEIPNRMFPLWETKPSKEKLPRTQTK